MSELLNDMSCKINTSTDRVDCLVSIITDFFDGAEPSALKTRFET